MNFTHSLLGLTWEEFVGQQVGQATYLFVAPKPISRLKGESDIVYVGRTKTSLNNRYKALTTTSAYRPGTDATNTRLSYLIRRLEMMEQIDLAVYFTRELNVVLDQAQAQYFDQSLRIWVKPAHTRKTVDPHNPQVEAYLLVRYATDHLELPPLNNRFASTV